MCKQIWSISVTTLLLIPSVLSTRILILGKYFYYKMLVAIDLFHKYRITCKVEWKDHNVCLSSTVLLVVSDWLHLWLAYTYAREGNGNPLQYCCLENPMDRGASWATVHGVTGSWTRLSNFTYLLTHLYLCHPGCYILENIMFSLQNECCILVTL